MARKLSDESLGEPISPLIDVVMNAFAAMFIILIIFISVFHRRDEPPPPPTFLTVEPSPLIRGQNYTFTLPVSGGIGQPVFRIVKGNLSAFGLSFETNTGTIFGLADVAAKGDPVSFPLTADCEFEVTDAAGRRDNRAARFRMSSGAVPFPETQLSILHQGTTLPGGRVGGAYEAVLGASGGVEPYRWQLVSGKLPQGLSLDSKQGRLFGLLNETGAFSFEVSAEHLPGTFQANGVRYNWSAGKSTHRYELIVHDVFRGSLSLPVGRVGEEYAGSFVSNGRLPQEMLSWSAQVPGLSFSEENGGITGIPQQAGVFDVAYRISGVPNDQTGGGKKLRILPAMPSKEAGAITIHTWVDSHTEALIPYRGMKEPAIITNLAPLPNGLIITGTRLVGTPKQPGTFSIPIVIRDSVGGITNGVIALLVHPSRQALGLAERLIIPLVTGLPVVWRPPTIGGEGRVSWTVDSPLPPGLTVSNNTLTGTVRTKGVWPARLTVRDEVAARSLTRNIEFRGIMPDETSVRLATTAIPTVIIGVPFDFVFAAEGGVGLPRFSLTGDLPIGLRFTANGISGTAQAAGDWRIISAVEDAAGQRDGPRQFLLSVSYGDQSQPLFLTTNIPPAVAGIAYDFAFSIGGGVGVPVFSLSGELPRGLTFTSIGISGVAQEIRDTTVEVSATDQAGRKTPPRRFAFRSLPNEVTKPEVTTSRLQPAVRGQLYLHEFAGEGGIGRYRWTIAGDLPPGLTLGTHGIEGTISQQARLGTWDLRISVRDEAENVSPEKALQLFVMDPK